MNTHPSYTLASRSDTGRHLRSWNVLTRGTLTSTLLAADLTLIVAMSCLTGIGYHLAIYGQAGEVPSYFRVGVLVASMFVMSNFLRDEYKIDNLFAFRPHLSRATHVWNGAFVCLLAIGFLAQITVTYSRGWMLSYYVSTIAVLLLQRYAAVQLTARAVAAGIISARRIFLVGTGQQISAFLHRYEPWKLGINIIGCRFLTPTTAEQTEKEWRDTIEADLEDAAESARILEPDAVFLVLPWSARETISLCADKFTLLPAEIHLAPEQILYRYDDVELSRCGTMSSLQLVRPPLSRMELLEKRVFDLVFAAIGLVLLTPALLVIAALIKLDSPGPVFFLQRRSGFNQQPFRIFKFRTMRTLDDGDVIKQATHRDPRVTRIGHWLRAWNLDEIPQLFNVLLGDMSLVGPRPHALSHNHEYERTISLYARRHNVKPGITGWAQIHGFRGQTDTEEKMRRRVEHDLYYIDHWSLWLDFSIVLRTALSPTAYRNAH